MPRKQFVQDLEKAKSGTFTYLHGIRRGDDDESLCFSFSTPGDPPLTLDFQAAVSDLSEYPHSHRYLIYSTSPTVPPAVVDILDVVPAAAAGAPLGDLLSTVSDALEKASSMDVDENAHQNQTTPGTYTDEDAMSLNSDNEADWEDAFFDEDQQFFGSGQKITEPSSSLRPDLRTAKAAGFKLGYLGNLKGSVIISVSCRIAKLGISEEAMQAWGVQRSQYLVLLLRFPHGYLDTKQILELQNPSSSVQMHVGLCASYKPTMVEATRAFTRKSAISVSQSDPLLESQGSGKLLPLFLEAPLGTLLNERFVPILKIRHSHSFSWSGAESFFDANQGLMAEYQDPQGSMDYFCQDERIETIRYLDQTDHFSDFNLDSLSFPLLAMQFTLRHFVKCTQFCLVCHCKIDAQFEALKPYVCSKPLCLYQYMALGMGPSIEWEIRRQPLVVDLLVSFAYTSAAAGTMEDLPIGLRMMVPRIYDKKSQRSGSLHRSSMQLTVEQGDKNMRFMSPGDWIFIENTESGEYKNWHCRVESTDLWPVIDLSEPAIRLSSDSKTANDLKEAARIHYYVHDMNFDDMGSKKEDKDNKQKVILNLLKSLPDVLTMKTWLDLDPSGSKLLSSWEKVPPAALDLLRWIVASNRSCIMQDGGFLGGKKIKASRNLISGMDGYLQFRFAQGSPDKEEKFMSAVNQVDSKHPTLFAWHGSSLWNWHSIIREGLHFKKVSNGRACGHGDYMAQAFSYSQTYAGMSRDSVTRTDLNWPNTILNIGSALSLNEVVNQPSGFVHCAHGIYVVSHLDWIQTRYLFVQCNAQVENLVDVDEVAEVAPKANDRVTFYAQDAKHIPVGSQGKAIEIPMTLFSQSRRRLALQNKESKPSKTGKKCKAKTKDMVVEDVPDVNDGDYDGDDDNLSVATLAEDIEALFSEADAHAPEDSEIEKELSNKKMKKETNSTIKTAKEKTTTDFEPGTLTESSITILQPPSYATSSATKALQQRLLQALKVQEKTPLEELGWCIDANLISNPYQWIVELHSFDLTHPLGRDFKKAGIQSIIMEMRFPSDYPMSPPFVRVIRPRLLEFSNGGGGHVTMGGALCMELLTNSGWLPTFSIENLLLSIRMAMCSMDPRPARLGGHGRSQDYSVHEAVEAYIRACRQHGWQVPPNFSNMAW